ncbi:T9SS type A sorting domain-containing protein, partial [Lacibacter sp. H407]|uniref:T9SS type A sorting domain-containing protein n=1 Tax=Lacibacter sp. H407 TaxID=3133423 RepID=UPI0030BBE540
VSCSASPNPIDITSAAHNTTLSASLAGSIDADPDNYTYLWEITQGVGSLSSTSAVSPVYTAAVGDAGGTVKFKVTVTHKRTGCFASSNCEVNVTAAGSCPTVETIEVCNGSTNSYTASRAPSVNETWVWSANNGASINAPNGQQTVSVTAGGQSFTLKLSISYANPDLGTNECTYEVPVIACGNFCTYTQGKYGNRSPLCDGDGIDGSGPAYTYPTVTDMIKAMLGVGGVGNPLYIGGNGTTQPRITIPSTSSAAVLLNASMPGGGKASELFGNCTVDNVPSLPACWTPGNNSSTTYITKQGRINNVFLSQTIALGLNLRVSSGLADFVLQAGTFATAARDGGCGSTTPKARSCYYNELMQLVVVNEYLYKTISVDIIAALTTKGYPHTVGGLYQLANDGLGNVDGVVGSEAGASLSSISGAAAQINEGFDECRIFIGWDVEPCKVEVVSRRINLNPSGTIANPNAIITDKLNVSTYPNPFIDRVRFVIASPVSGQATLEVFDMMGRKLQTVYSGFISAGRNQVVEYKTSTNANGTLIYKLRIGTDEVTGKLVNIRQ